MSTLKSLYKLLCVAVLAWPLMAQAVPPDAPLVRYQVYSESAIELFWQTPSSDSLVTGYEISRDGEVLGVFDALSYFDDSLQSDTEYTYTVSAMNSNGERSDEAVVTLATRMPETVENRIAELEREIRDLRAQLENPIPAPLPRTGQTQSIFPGDDGDYQSGVALPEPRFTINVNADDDLNQNGLCDADETCNGSVTDALTGLTWLQNAGCRGIHAFADAVASANRLAGDGSSTCQLTDGSQAGDWRLPNIRELLSIIDFSQSFPDLTLPRDHPFTEVVEFEESGFPASYYSSTTFNGTGAYTVSLTVGWINRQDHGNAFSVLPVRD